MTDLYPAMLIIITAFTIRRAGARAGRPYVRRMVCHRMLAYAYDKERTFTMLCIINVVSHLISVVKGLRRRPIVIAPGDAAPLGARNPGCHLPQFSVSVRRRIIYDVI